MPNTDATPAIAGGNPAWTVLCDFDGTISPDDTADRLIEAFGNARCQDLEQAWVAGEIGSRACMGGQIGELRATRAELDRLVDGIRIDDGFADFVNAAEGLGLEVLVVSDGLDYVVSRILARHGLQRLPLYANRLNAVAEDRWSLTFPFAERGCASGHCKCQRAETATARGRRSLLIGDGTSDFCVAARADRVWAKGRLAEHCRQQLIAHQPLQDFHHAQALLAELCWDATGRDDESDDQRRRILA